MRWFILAILVGALWRDGEGRMVARCLPGWGEGQRGSDQCYTKPDEKWKKNFNQARHFCTGHGGDSLIIKDEETLAWVKSRLESLGLSQAVYTNAKKSDGAWKWVEDKTEVDTKLLPLSADEQGPCGVLLPSGKLKGVDCNDKHIFMCHRGIDIPPSCDYLSGYEEMAGHCYKISDEQRTWNESLKDCNDDEGSLITISDSAEQRFARDLCHHRVDYVWIGLTEMGHKGDYEWTDGSESNFTDWEDGQPDPATGGNGCGAIDPEDGAGRWVSVDCETNAYDYICEKKQGACVYGWEPFGESCYYFNTEKSDVLVWENAKATCDEVGAHLVIIDGEEENSFISEHMQPDDNLWIGLKSKSKDKFYWTDDTEMTFTSMSDKDKEEALALDEDRCVNFHLTDPKTIAWTPMDCYLPRHYVCEVKQGVPIHLIHHPTEKYCPHGWLMNEDRCYYLSDVEKTWQDAREYCQDNQADLISVNSWTEQDFVHTNIDTGILIGYSDEMDEGVWVWNDRSTGGIVNWDTGEPNGQKTQNCGLMYATNGKWDDWYCDKARNFGCEMPASDTPLEPTATPTTTVPPYSEACGPGWIENHLTGECYFFFLEEMDQFSAQEHCRRLDESSDVTLLTLSTKAEHVYVWDYIRHQYYSQQAFTIGMKNEINKGNYWMDDTPVSFFNWYYGEPSGDGTCTEMYVTGGKFNDISCDEKQAFVCEKKGLNYSPPSPPSPPDPICPSGWTAFNRHCYYFNNSTDTWNGAKSWCESNLNSNLASVENADENDFLTGMAASMNLDLWLGLHDDEAGANWHWTDGSDLGRYNNWADNQPDDYHGLEHCGELKRGQGKWNDLECDQKLGFVCKITLDICPSGWKFWNDKCYHTSEEASPNDEARQKCKEFNTNADLVTIENEEENEYFADMFRQSSLGVWNGYKYDTGTKNWQWADGSSSTFTNWNDGEPNNLDREFCTEVIDAPSLDTHGKWNNLQCSEARNFGCEYFPQHYLGCEEGWELFNDVCYKAAEQNKNYFDSESYCKSLGAQVATVHSAKENEFLASIIPAGSTDAWIGITDIDHENSFTCSDGTNFVYSNWKRLECDYSLEFAYEKCASLLPNGKWKHNDCENRITTYVSVICTKPPEAKKIEPEDTGCRNGDFFYRGSCYSISDSKLTWEDAKKACESADSYLLKMEEKQEGDFFFWSFGDYGVDAWTDVRVRRYSDGSADFAFDGGKLATYLPWDSFEPNLQAGDCVFLTGTSRVAGMYRVAACEKELNYLCEYDRQGYTTLPPEPTPTHGTNCLDRWSHYQGHCYEVFPDTHTWFQAEEVCESYGGHLVSINSREEESSVQDLLWMHSIYTYENFWVGLELDTEADKHWTDGSSIDYLHWAAGQPKMHDHENCASITRQSTTLSCTVCESHLPFICETREGTVVTTLQPPTFLPPKQCVDGDGIWYVFKDHCYKFISATEEDPQSWDKSAELCLAEGSHLASITDVEENFFIESMLDEFSDDGIWVGGRALADSGFQWVDGSPFSYDNWAPGEPNSFQDQEDCIEMYNRRLGTWNDKNCGHLTGRVCKRPKGATVPPPSPTEPPSGNCPEGWIHVGATGRCFKLVETTEYFDFIAAKCRSLYDGADAVSLHNPKEMAYITAMVGLHGHNVWIGLKYEMREYVWIDQSTVDYTPWAPGEPNGQYMAENCVQAIYPTGLMNDISCYNNLAYICAMQQDPSITEPTSLPKCEPPYDKYYSYKDECYRPEKTPMTWEDAEKTCAAEGSHLASAYDVHQNSFLWILGQEDPMLHPWIGLNNRKVQSTYEWSDNWPVTYTNWGEAQPQVNVTDKNCVMLDSDDGHWYNERCDEPKPFLCKHSEDEAPSPGPPITGHCQDDTWTSLPGPYCYLVVKDLKDWNDAHSHCMFLDSNLTSIHSEDENALLKHSIQGLKLNIWLGLIQKSTGLGWSDGTPFDYQNWAEGEPSMDYEQCTEFYHEDGKWNDLPCSSYRAFICRAVKIPDKEPTNPTLPPLPPTDSPFTGGGLSGGAIFGIVFAVLFAFAAVGFVGMSLVKKKNTNTQVFNSGRTGGVVNLSHISEEKESSVAYIPHSDVTDA
ncbi:macrophage mannose receptor 1-like isoform X2 [Macrobrachium rosenbergii]|uniref:macrophage mannose receptor 1-like isoform X2 n=1 Tax=Macrobrachium rosenbergii TaxID=79674 RepID=UPI0034D4572F